MNHSYLIPNNFNRIEIEKPTAHSSDIEIFLYLLFNEIPEIKTNFRIDVEKICYKKPRYRTNRITVRFPSQYRDKVIFISKFCGIYFEREIYESITDMFEFIAFID